MQRLLLCLSNNEIVILYMVLIMLCILSVFIEYNTLVFITCDSLSQLLSLAEICFKDRRNNSSQIDA